MTALGREACGRQFDHKCADDQEDEPDDDEGGERAHWGDDTVRPMPPTLRFLTRRDCHLCEDALALLAGTQLEIIDIDLDPDLLRIYDARVPVLLDSSTGGVLIEGVFTPETVSEAVG